jgi:hypothetical protein
VRRADAIHVAVDERLADALDVGANRGRVGIASGVRRVGGLGGRRLRGEGEQRE